MMQTTYVVLLDSECDRCGKLTDELRPYTLTNSITYRRRVIEFPWLCAKCLLVEKKKWWKTQSGTVEA